MSVHVVYDLKGAGRVVGVFTDLTRARSVVAINPAYYKITTMALDEISDTVFEWLAGSDQRAALASIARRENK